MLCNKAESGLLCAVVELNGIYTVNMLNFKVSYFHIMLTEHFTFTLRFLEFPRVLGFISVQFNWKTYTYNHWQPDLVTPAKLTSLSLSILATLHFSTLNFSTTDHSRASSPILQP